MRTVVSLVALAGFGISLVVHLATFADIAMLERTPELWPLFYGIPLLYLGVKRHPESVSDS